MSDRTFQNEKFTASQNWQTVKRLKEILTTVEANSKQSARLTNRFELRHVPAEIFSHSHHVINNAVQLLYRPTPLPSLTMYRQKQE